MKRVSFKLQMWTQTCVCFSPVLLCKWSGRRGLQHPTHHPSNSAGPHAPPPATWLQLRPVPPSGPPPRLRFPSPVPAAGHGTVRDDPRSRWSRTEPRWPNLQSWRRPDDQHVISGELTFDLCDGRSSEQLPSNVRSEMNTTIIPSIVIFF